MNLLFLCLASFVVGIPSLIVSSQEDETRQAYIQTVNFVRENYYDKRRVEEILSEGQIERCSPSRSSSEELYASIDCLLEKFGDPYMRFLPPSHTVSEQNMIKEYKSVGFGLVLDPLEPSKVLEVIEASPADKAGIKAGDVIVSVNDIPLKYLKNDEIQDFLEPPVVNSEITVDWQRGNYTVFSKELEAQEMKAKLFKAKFLSDKIVYLRIKDFLSLDLIAQVKEFLKSPKVQATEGMIIDLRNNSGGLLKNGFKFADLFLEKGTVIAKIMNRDSSLVDIEAEQPVYYSKPVIILMNGNTASSAEIVAVSLKENERAFLIGTNTFGKGSVQKIKLLKNGISLHVTVSKLFSPSGVKIDGVGVKPDLIIRRDSEQLASAISRLTETK